MKRLLIIEQRGWPCGFREGEPVTCKGRRGHVFPLHPSQILHVGAGEVPVLFDDEDGRSVSIIPADDLLSIFSKQPSQTIVPPKEDL
jgi:hypothetical protein